MRCTNRVMALLMLAGLALGLTQCTKGGVALVPERREVWQRPRGQADREVTQDSRAGQGDNVWTELQGRALLKWPDLWVRLYDDTELHMDVLTPTGVTLAVDAGTILNGGMPKLDQYVVKTDGYAEIKLVGSTVMVAYHPGTSLTLVRVFDGQAEVRNLSGDIQTETVSTGEWALVRPAMPPEVFYNLEDMRGLAQELGLWDVFHAVELDVEAGFGPSGSQVPPEDVDIVFVEEATPTPTRTPTPTQTRMPSPTWTRTPTPSPTRTSLPTWTRTPTPTQTRMPSPTWTRMPSPTWTRTPTHSPTRISLPTWTRTSTPTRTRTPTSTRTRTPTSTRTRTPTPTRTRTPTRTMTPVYKPDLVVTTLQATGPATITSSGIEVPIYVVVRNQGNVVAATFKVATEYTISGSQGTFVVAFTVQGQQSSWYPMTGASLAAGREVGLRGKVTFLRSLQGKTVSLRAMADSCSGEEFMPAYCRVAESNENNNYSKALVLSLPAEGPD